MWEFMTILGDALRIATFQSREPARYSPRKRRPAEPDRSPFARAARSTFPWPSR